MVAWRLMLRTSVITYSTGLLNDNIHMCGCDVRRPAMHVAIQHVLSLSSSPMSPGDGVVNYSSALHEEVVSFSFLLVHLNAENNIISRSRYRPTSFLVSRGLHKTPSIVIFLRRSDQCHRPSGYRAVMFHGIATAECLHKIHSQLPLHPSRTKLCRVNWYAS